MSRDTAPPVVWALVHDLDRTGVPVVLERLLGADAAARTSVHVVAWRGGSLGPAVERRCASLTVLEPGPHRSTGDAAAVGLRALGATGAARRLDAAVWRRRLRGVPPPDVVLVHGAGAWPLVVAAPDAAPVVLHLHELHTALDRCIVPDEQRAALRRARSVLVVSAAVADLARQRGARPATIELVPGVVDPPAQDPEPALAGRDVMGAGSPGWRKGTDRLAAVAAELDRRGHPEAVGWVGGRPSGIDAPAVDAVDPVEWFPATEDPWQRLRSASVIVVPSREDPLPLVALEAGREGLPVVAMPTGGLPELLADGRGVVADGHDLGRFVDGVSSLLDEPDRAAAMGAALRAHVLDRYRVDVIAPQWWAILRRAAG